MKKIILITGNQLNYESGIIENYFDSFEKEEKELNKTISNLYISQFYKFPNYVHIKLFEFIKKYKDKLIHYDQSVYNFWDSLNHFDLRRLEGNINQIKCLNCNRIFSLKKIGNKKECPKCKSDKLINNLLFKNSNVNQYKVLLEDIGFKTMKNLFFQIKNDVHEISNKQEKNNIWNVDLRNNNEYIIIVIGYNEEIIELNNFFKDAIKLKPQNYKVFSLNMLNLEEEKFTYFKNSNLLSNDIDEFLLIIEKEINI